MTKANDTANTPKTYKLRDELPDAALDKVAGGNAKFRNVTPGKE